MPVLFIMIINHVQYLLYNVPGHQEKRKRHITDISNLDIKKHKRKLYLSVKTL